MPDNYVSVHVHIVWATWDRAPIIVEQFEGRIHAEIQQAAERLGAEVLAVGGMPDHVHLLTSLPTTISIAEFVKKIKGPSSHFANHALAYGGAFRWQGAYACLAVSDECLTKVRAYVGRQREHHEWGGLEPGMELPDGVAADPIQISVDEGRLRA